MAHMGWSLFGSSKTIKYASMIYLINGGENSIHVFLCSLNDIAS
jgi:hypothetical protein